jgi:hypothetical protein
MLSLSLLAPLWSPRQETQVSSKSDEKYQPTAGNGGNGLLHEKAMPASRFSARIVV